MPIILCKVFLRACLKTMHRVADSEMVCGSWNPPPSVVGKNVNFVKILAQMSKLKSDPYAYRSMGRIPFYKFLIRSKHLRNNLIFLCHLRHFFFVHYTRFRFLYARFKNEPIKTTTKK